MQILGRYLTNNNAVTVTNTEIQVANINGHEHKFICYAYKYNPLKQNDPCSLGNFSN